VLCLNPQAIATRPRSIAFVDLVATGSTFRSVTNFILEWARDERFDMNAVRRRLRFVGITWRKKTSPNVWRWQQSAKWLAAFRPSTVKNVSIGGRMWDYMGNTQQKVARTQPQWRWNDEEWRTAPPRSAEALESLRLALRIFDTGRSRQEETLFSRELAKQPSLSRVWLRALVAELRRTSKSRSA
jgi:hypothetical protein